jgi:hypothetical protein
LGGRGGACKSPQFTKAQGMLRVLERGAGKRFVSKSELQIFFWVTFVDFYLLLLLFVDV